MPRIALLFEYPTLNGGERSMLAVVDHLLCAGGVSPPQGDAGSPQAAIDANTAGATRPRHTDIEFEFIAIAPEAGPLANALAERAIDVVPLQIYDASGHRLPPVSAASRLRQTLETCNADLLHANSLAMGRLTGALGDDFPIPRVAHLRDIIKLSAAAIADLNRNDRLIAVSQATRAFHVAQGLKASKTHVVHNGIPKPAGRTRPDPPERSRAALGIPDDAFVVLTVGQIGLRKGQDVLAEAASIIKARRPRPAGSARARPGGFDFHFLIVGERNSNKPESIAFEANLKQRFHDACLADRLHMPGYRDDVLQLMRDADLLVHPAKQEPLGRVLLEAAAAGLPIVATDVGGTSEILTDGESARLVPPNDPAALADAILELAASPELRARFANAARKTIEMRFTVEESAAAIAGCWRSVLTTDGGETNVRPR